MIILIVMMIMAAAMVAVTIAMVMMLMTRMTIPEIGSPSTRVVGSHVASGFHGIAEAKIGA